jgi:hypothetical protein
MGTGCHRPRAGPLAMRRDLLLVALGAALVGASLVVGEVIGHVLFHRTTL